MDLHAAWNDSIRGVDFVTFVNSSDNLTSFIVTYHVGRLSLILSLYLAHAVLPPVAANVVPASCGVLCRDHRVLSRACAMTVGRRPALVVSVLLGAYQPFLNAVGLDQRRRSRARLLFHGTCVRRRVRSRQPATDCGVRGLVCALVPASSRTSRG